MPHHHSTEAAHHAVSLIGMFGVVGAIVLLVTLLIGAAVIQGRA